MFIMIHPPALMRDSQAVSITERVKTLPFAERLKLGNFETDDNLSCVMRT